MCPAKSAFAEQESKDKKMVDKGIIETKKFISTQNFDSATKMLSQISPASRRLNYKSFEIAILNSFLHVKQNNWKEAKGFVQAATRLRPDDPTPWKLMIQVESEIGTNDTLRSTLHRALETSSPDGSLLAVVGPYLKKYDDDSLTGDFVRLIEIIPDGINLPVVEYIPENPKTVDIRTRMLERAASKDEKSCSDLIHILLDEDDPFKATKYAKILPPEHIDRIYVETLIGDDPLNSARKHVELGSNRFRDFLIAADSHNLTQMRTEVNLIPPFVSGWTFLANLERDPKNRIQILNDAIQKFPKFIGFRKQLANAKEEAKDIDGAISIINIIRKNFDAHIGSEMLIKVLIRTGRCKEAASLLTTDKDLVVTDYEKATIEFELFKEDCDPNRLRRIIDLPESASLAGIKAEAAWGLRSELKDRQDDVERLFAAALRCDRHNGRAYLMFGKWQLEFKRDLEKAVYLLVKSAELGCVDSEAYEIVTRKFIEENKLSEALDLLSKVDTKWSHFRAALIHQRLENHELAAAEFQLDLRFNPDRTASWRALGHSYILLGRAMAAKSVAEHLREVNSPDLSLEFELANIFGRPINNNIYDIEATPQPFHAYLTQTVETIRRLKKLGRIESAKEIIREISNDVQVFVEKWPNLATVMKISGDFYIEAFILTHLVDHANNSLKCFKKRCETDRRAESFIDFAHSLQLLGQIEASVSVLRRVLKTFSDHSGIWLNLGISFALLSKFSFARHCLCVSSKLANEIEQARSYSCLSNVAMLINDNELLLSGIEAARRTNPFDPDVWQIIAATSNNTDIEAALISFQFGSSESIVKSLPELFLKINKPLEALGFSLMTNDDSLISASFEAIGRYDLALRYEKDEKKCRLLNCLIGNVDEKEFPNIKLYLDGRENEAAKHFIEKDDFHSKLAAAICLSKSCNTEKALELFIELKKEPVFAYQVERIMLQVIPNNVDLCDSLSFVQKDPELFFLDQIRRNSRIESAKNLIKRFPSETTAIEIFVIESLKSKSENIDNDAVLTKARTLYNSKSSVRTLVLLTCCLMRTGARAEAVKNLQIISVLMPKIALNIQKLLFEIMKEKDTNI